MAKINKKAKYCIEVTTNPKFCGVDAGDVQFANGKAVVNYSPIVNWYMEHEGYKVTEVTSG